MKSTFVTEKYLYSWLGKVLRLVPDGT